MPNSFTIVKMEQRHRTQNHNPDWVWVTVHCQTSGQGFEIRIHPSDFDAWTDQEVKDRIHGYCQTWRDNKMDNYDPQPDAARDTRMATFVNDEIEVT